MNTADGGLLAHFFPDCGSFHLLLKLLTSSFFRRVIVPDCSQTQTSSKGPTRAKVALLLSAVTDYKSYEKVK
jgi:hypothetical protein